MNGVLAALLAREGYTGPSSVFEGKHGLLATHAESYNPEMLTEGLGSEYKILGCKFKPYACCHELCPLIRMAQQLQADHGIKPQEVEKIRIWLNHITAENQLKEAETPLHAQNHPAVAIGIALVEDKVFLKEHERGAKNTNMDKEEVPVEGLSFPETSLVVTQGHGTGHARPPYLFTALKRWG